jgi:hypothetical protein
MVNLLARVCVAPKQNGVAQKPHIISVTLLPISRPLSAASRCHIALIEREF